MDISHYQGLIDWEKVPRQGPQKKDFAIMKASGGSDFSDPSFARNIEGAIVAGLNVGAYHFFDPKVDPKTQADFFVSHLKDEYFPLAPCLDVEDADGWDQMDEEQRAQAVITFLMAVQEQIGGPLVLYTYASFWNANLSKVPTGDYFLWLARYKPTVPAGWQRYSIWQYDCQARITGIPGTVDLDRTQDGVPWSDLSVPAKQ